MTSAPNSATQSAVRELDHRSTDGLEVTLFWDPEQDLASVAVVDTKTEDAFVIDVGDDENALDVFRHPYAYAARRDGASGTPALLVAA